MRSLTAIGRRFQVQLGDQKLVVGTAHLDSLAEDGTKTSKSVSREQQVVELVDQLSQAADHQDADALWIGDTNWVDAQDGALWVRRDCGLRLCMDYVPRAAPHTCAMGRRVVHS